AGFSESLEVSPCGDVGSQVVQNFYFQGQTADNNYPFYPNEVCFLREQGTQDGKAVTVSVLFATDVKPYTWVPADGPAADLKVGQILVAVDVVTARAVENRMVTVSATDMADALATKGAVELYGILFDVDKTVIKPESTQTLDQIATLLKIDRSLKLEVSGH